jgi:hypothetical protein
MSLPQPTVWFNSPCCNKHRLVCTLISLPNTSRHFSASTSTSTFYLDPQHVYHIPKIVYLIQVFRFGPQVNFAAEQAWSKKRKRYKIEFIIYLFIYLFCLTYWSCCWSWFLPTTSSGQQCRLPFQASSRMYWIPPTNTHWCPFFLSRQRTY